MKLRTETQDSEMMHEICIVRSQEPEMTAELKANLEYLVNHINSLGKKEPPKKAPWYKRIFTQKE